jgi:peptidyl-prolyl cis-trans isomerase C
MCAVWLVPSGAAAQPEAATEGAQEETKPLAASVGDDVILLEDLDLAVNQYVINQRLGPDSGISIQEIQRKVLNQLIIIMLANQRAQELGLAATEEEVDARLADLRAQMGSPDDFRLMLTVQNLTEEKLREQLAQSLAAEKLVRTEVLEKISIRDAEVRAYYTAHKDEMVGPEKVKARHIFVRLRPEMSAEERDAARQKIDGIKERLSAGEDFAELAVELSEDAAAASGGDLGWILRGQVQGPFEVVAFSLPVNRISEVVSTDYGYHILQVLERQEAGIVELEEARPMIEQKIREEKERVGIQKFLDDLRAKGSVETFVPGLDAGS